MQYQEIGRSGVSASRVALGVMRLAGKSVEQACHVLDTALACGINFIDTADIYGRGKSSSVLGKALRELGVERDRVLLQTKLGIYIDPKAKAAKRYDFTHDHLIAALDQELELLQTDYVDFVLLHRPDPLADLQELADTFTELKAKGKVRHFGVSNMGPWQVELMQSALSDHLEVNQLQFGLMHSSMIRSQLHTNMEDAGTTAESGDVLSYSQLRGMTLQAWSPFQYGASKGCFIDNDKFPQLNALLAAIAARHGVAKETIATAWILRHPSKIQVIPGSMTPSRIRNIATATEVELTRQEWWDLYLAAGNDLP